MKYSMEIITASSIPPSNNQSPYHFFAHSDGIG